MATKAKTQPVSLGALVDQLWSKREKKRELEATVKVLDGEISDLETEIMEQMNANGLDKMSGERGSVSITENVVANVTDWEAFWAYVHKMKYGHLLQRRVSDPAYRELLEQGKKPPGVEPFVKKRLNLRSR